jgi:hypothetical protein
MKENRLRWFGHVMRKEETKAIRVVMKVNIEGKRERGRPKKRLLNTIVPTTFIEPTKSSSD